MGDLEDTIEVVDLPNFRLEGASAFDVDASGSGATAAASLPSPSPLVWQPLIHRAAAAALSSRRSAAGSACW